MEITRGLILKSLFWKYLEKSGVQGVSFIVSIVLARLIAPSEFGLIAIVMILIELSNVIVDGGFNSALVQKKEPTNTDFSTILYVSIIVSVVIYAIIYVVSPYIADFYSETRLSHVLRVLCILLVVKAFNSVQNAYISKKMLFKKSFICHFVAVVVSGTTGIVLAYMGYGIWALVCQQIVSQLGVCLAMWFFVRWRPSLLFSKESLKNLFNFGWKVFVTNAMIAFFVNVRGLLVGKMFGPSDLAFFERGRQFPNIIISNLSSTIQAILFPVFANKQDDPVAVKSMLRRSIKTSTLFVAPMMVALIVMTKPIVLLLLTEKWLPAVPFMQIFCIAYLIMPIQTSNMQVITALGRSDLLLKLETWKKVLEFSILIASFMFGVLAVAWGTVLYNFICLFINLYPNRQLINYGYIKQLKDIAPTLLLSLIMGIIMYGVSIFVHTNLLLLVTQTVAGVFTYCIMCYLFRIEACKYILDLLYYAKRN